jgi:peptidoglycan-associated lipoprotein
MRRFANVAFTLALLAAGLPLVGCHSHRAPLAPLPEAPAAAAPAPPAPPVCKLTAEPAAIDAGKSVTLSWSSQNATDVSIDPSLGKQLTEGSVTASPENSTTYVLTATGPSGTATCTARVTVSAAAAPPAPSVSEENIPGGSGAGSPSTQIQDIFFDYDSADLRPDAQQTLTRDAALLKAHTGVPVAIQGNCDQRGSEEYNLGLGQRRANAARDFLANLGVPASSMSTVSFGKDRLVCTDNTEDCYKQNRRDHLEVKQ